MLGHLCSGGLHTFKASSNSKLSDFGFIGRISKRRWLAQIERIFHEIFFQEIDWMRKSTHCLRKVPLRSWNICMDTKKICNCMTLSCTHHPTRARSKRPSQLSRSLITWSGNHRKYRRNSVVILLWDNLWWLSAKLRPLWTTKQTRKHKWHLLFYQFSE